ncbi:MFS transporter [Skermanella mucosa]|uniref:MFS transporter n=1 Tax=Skermanella mucosa TaxID=1789672 RepID=UPI00192A7AF4|nr:MFS transporter [Skermanella mucosa]UEM19101.1 MFS transporter [Skermanella mucosa]
MSTATAAVEGAGHGLSPALTAACAVACGAMVANLYYAQPLIDLIAPELSLSGNLSGMIVTLTQLGYGAGLLLIVPLADRVENRRLILTTLLCAAAALAGVGLSSSAPVFLVAAVAVGFCSAGAQVIVPFAASLAPEERRGRTIGNIMAGLLAGIMLARPAASLLADMFGWRAVFWVSAGLMLLLAGWLAKALPKLSRAEARRTESGDYGRMLRSLWRILVTTPALQRRAVYQGILFAVFNIFWTAAPLMLARSFGYGQKGIALFALAGAGGALAAPLAGRLGDRGHVRAGTAAALATVTLSCVLSGWAAAIPSLAALVFFAVTLDAATQVNQVLGQRVIYSLPGDARGRMNAIYMTIVFVLGAGGSAVATLTYHHGGWWTSMLAGGILGLVALAVFATEFRRPAGTAGR